MPLTDPNIVVLVATSVAAAALHLPHHAVIIADTKIRRTEYGAAIIILNQVIKCLWIGRALRASAHLSRSIAFTQTADAAKAVDDCNKALQLIPHNGYAYGLRSLAKTMSYDADSAVVDAETAISLSPQFCVGYCALGSALSHLNQYKQALDNFNTAVSLETRAPEIYLYRAVCLCLLNREYDAIADCNTAQLLNPLLPRSYTLRAYSYLRLGNFQLAEYDLDKVEALNPNDPLLWICRSRLLLAQARAGEALELVDKFVQVHPTTQASFLVVRAVICKAMARYEEAERCLDDALRINPRNLEALWHHGDTLEKTGKSEQGLTEKANAIDFGYTPKP